MHLYVNIQRIMRLYNIHLFNLRESVQIHYVALDDREQCTFTSIAI